jgi:hypothetical protein
VEPQTSREETTPQDQQRVTEDGPDHAGLNQPDLPLHQGEDADEEFDGVSESSVQETTESVAGSESQLLGRERQQGCKRNDGEEGEDEDDDVGLVGKVKSPGDGNERKEVDDV